MVLVELLNISPVFWLGAITLSLFFVYRILLENRDPAPQWAWLFTVIFLPYFGVFLYFILSGNRLVRKTHRKLLTSEAQRGVQSNAETEKNVDINAIEENFRPVTKITTDLTQANLSFGNEVTIYSDAQKAYQDMFLAIENAEKYILLEKFIFRDDSVGKKFLQRLTQKAKEGVKVRILVDRFGSLSLSFKTFKETIQAGARFEWFKTIHISRAIFLPNFRNHRKILVVDGKIGFTGGMNIGQEYIDWYDRHLKIQGPGVHDLQDIFAEDWYYTCSEKISFLEQDTRIFKPGEMIQIIDFWPDYIRNPLERVFLSAIHMAKERVYLTTPYFVPDSPMRSALITAADRGIDVRIIIPKHTDHFILNMVSRSYMHELISVGIRFYLYTPGMYHAKTLLVDDYFASIGSANIDARSFQWNFETSVFIYGKDFARTLKHSLLEDQKNSELISEETFRKMSKWEILVDNIARLFSPIV